MQQNVDLQTKVVGYLQQYNERQMWTNNNHEQNRITPCELCQSWLIQLHIRWCSELTKTSLRDTELVTVCTSFCKQRNSAYCS